MVPIGDSGAADAAGRMGKLFTGGGNSTVGLRCGQDLGDGERDGGRWRRDVRDECTMVEKTSELVLTLPSLLDAMLFVGDLAGLQLLRSGLWWSFPRPGSRWTPLRAIAPLMRSWSRGISPCSRWCWAPSIQPPAAATMNRGAIERSRRGLLLLGQCAGRSPLAEPLGGARAVGLLRCLEALLLLRRRGAVHTRRPGRRHNGWPCGRRLASMGFVLFP